MQGNSEPIYRRGKYWLAPDVRADGTPRSPYLAVWWYDPAARRTRSRSSKTAEVEAAIMFLDRLYLADATEAPAYCPTCGAPRASAKAYLLTDAIADYRIEVGDNRSSADSIKARLNHVLDYLDAANLTGASCADVTEAWIGRFRRWSAAKPVEHKKKDGTVTVTRPRSPAATEASVMQVKAALNHAFTEKRIEAAPAFKQLGNKKVSRPVTARIDVPTIAKMLAYAAESPRRRALHRFLIASICTIARPDAIFDMSTDHKRGQWRPGEKLIDLNPQGRAQTKKHRPILPVQPLLAHWLDHTLDTAKADKGQSGGWLVNHNGEPVESVGTAWTKMLAHIGLPTGRAYQPYVLRRSLATICRERGATHWDLAGHMGHSIAAQTESYAATTLYPTAQAALASVIAELEKLVPSALHRTCTGAGGNVTPLVGASMEGKNLVNSKN